MDRPRPPHLLGYLLLALVFSLSSGPDRLWAAEAAMDMKIGKHVTIDPEAWKWNWASWDQEKIVSFGQFQYTLFWDADRVMVLARRDLRDDSIQTVRLPKFTLSADDRHRNTCLGVSAADGRLHLSWDHHGNELRYTKTLAGFLTEPPEWLSIDQIEPAQPMLGDPALEQTVTYPRFFTDPKGTLFCFYRIGGSGNGDNYLHRYHPADGAWTRLGMVFSHRGTYAPWNNDKSRCVYMHDLLFFYPTYDPVPAGFRYFVASPADQWQTWSGPHRLTGPELGGCDASKHDRVRWAKEGILSFTAMPEPDGFAILDANIEAGPNRDSAP
ncbi:MAG: BNR-4 repeat-containing protein [Thermoguttaceae bacterium]